MYSGTHSTLKHTSNEMGVFRNYHWSNMIKRLTILIGEMSSMYMEIQAVYRELSISDPWKV